MLALLPLAGWSAPQNIDITKPTRERVKKDNKNKKTNTSDKKDKDNNTQDKKAPEKKVEKPVEKKTPEKPAEKKDVANNPAPAKIGRAHV